MQHWLHIDEAMIDEDSYQPSGHISELTACFGTIRNDSTTKNLAK